MGGICIFAIYSADSKLILGATRTLERNKSLISLAKASLRFSLPMRNQGDPTSTKSDHSNSNPNTIRTWSIFRFLGTGVGLNPRKTGAGEGIRTVDPNLGKVVLYP